MGDSVDQNHGDDPPPRPQRSSSLPLHPSGGPLPRSPELVCATSQRRQPWWRVTQARSPASRRLLPWALACPFWGREVPASDSIAAHTEPFAALTGLSTSVRDHGWTADEPGGCAVSVTRNPELHLRPPRWSQSVPGLGLVLEPFIHAATKSFSSSLVKCPATPGPRAESGATGPSLRDTYLSCGLSPGLQLFTHYKPAELVRALPRPPASLRCQFGAITRMLPGGAVT